MERNPIMDGPNLDYDRWYAAIDNAWRAKIRRQRLVRRAALAITGLIALAVCVAVALAKG